MPAQTEPTWDKYMHEARRFIAAHEALAGTGDSTGSDSGPSGIHVNLYVHQGGRAGCPGRRSKAWPEFWFPNLRRMQSARPARLVLPPARAVPVREPIGDDQCP